MKDIIEKTLSELGVTVILIGSQVTPQVTRYFVSPVNGSKRVKLTKIRSFADDLAVALGRYPVRVVADPAHKAIAIEVPNATRQFISLKNVLKVENLRRVNGLKVVLGVDQNGHSVIFSLSDAPHTLIAGATGSGKSVCINAMITSLTKTYKPGEVQLILVDPKRVELEQFNGLPHLWLDVITDARHASIILSMMLGLMDRRYRGFQQGQVRSIDEYNAKYTDKQPRFVIVIDELADLMITRGKEIEPKLVRLAQLGRAAGIHLVMATQRPSVDVVTGLIKANCPSRIVFKTSSGIDSRVMEMHGAEKLLGKGDGIVKDSTGKRVRFQGCYV